MDRDNSPHSPTLPLALHDLFRIRGVLDPSSTIPGLQVSMSASLALGRLRDAGPISQHDLGNWLGLEKSTVSRLVAGLVTEGWVQKRPNPNGSRSPQLHLTQAGRTVTERMLQAMHERHERLLAALSPAERQSAAVALPALIRALNAEVDENS
jgi:DNA-binding MarR family transcriptional regulator